MNLKVLFSYLRNSPFGGRLSSAQVNGVEAILNECQRQGVTNVAFIAYILATAYHETGGTMEPVTENLNYSTAARIRAVWPAHFASNAAAAAYVKNPMKLAKYVYGVRKAVELGNKTPIDGWTFIGRGLVQITGRKNYARYGIAGSPAEAGKLAKAAHIIVHGMTNGIFTGRKLSQYVGKDGVFDPYEARRIVNGTDKAQLIATYYVAFAGALRKAQEASAATAKKLYAADAKPDELAVEDMPDIKPGSDLPDDVKPADSLLSKVLAGFGGTGLLGTILAALTNPYALAGFALMLVVVAAIGYMHFTGKLTELRK